MGTEQRNQHCILPVALEFLHTQRPFPPPQVHGNDFIIQRIEAQASIFPKLRQRCLHQRHHSLQRTPASAAATDNSGGEDQGGAPGPSASAMVRLSQQPRPLPVLYNDGHPVIDVTALLELYEDVRVTPSADAIDCGGGSSGMVSCSAAVHVPQYPQPGSHHPHDQVRCTEGRCRPTIMSSCSIGTC